ncbi:dTDP-4-dehydrorhamnose reductase [uncultured Marinobacter sp.]|uniref:dTDP-4-dehydrorhamnose reductase n=1 Tax=uncultured Marinobacter sp. TaxID=187379 RepID=UPI0025855D78|nr:dTDP-4-dehydrorhamnose reductase [uncultured Marinobacter sp.]
MRVMVTGASGQLGKCLQDVLAGSGHEVIAVGHKELDITDRAAVDRFVDVKKPDIIINAAAYTAVDRAEEEAELAFKVNAQAVGNLADASNAAGAILIHVSTDYVFDGSSRTPYKETDSVNPMGTYGESKLAGEREAGRAQRHIIVRTAWVFSEYGNNFLKTMVKLGRERESLSIVDDQIGTPTYAGDLASALVSLGLDQSANGVYHFSGGDPCSWYEFASAIFATCAEISNEFAEPAIFAIPSSEYPTPARRPEYSVLDGSFLATRAGIMAVNWRVCLKDVCTKVLAELDVSKA